MPKLSFIVLLKASSDTSKFSKSSSEVTTELVDKTPLGMAVTDVFVNVMPNFGLALSVGLVTGVGKEVGLAML